MSWPAVVELIADAERIIAPMLSTMRAGFARSICIFFNRCRKILTTESSRVATATQVEN